MTGSPHPAGRRAVLRGLLAAGATAALPPLLSPAPAHAAASSGRYAIRFDLAPRQTIKGLGFELQSDSIGSSNDGLPELVSGVPHDLVPSERSRFHQQMLKVRADRGFRYCRLALGLYHRGLDASGERFTDRYEGQTALLAELIRESGVEGVAAEYWSPAPTWKSNDSLIGGTLAPDTDLDAMGDAMVADLRYLSDRGVPVLHWGLQNEPGVSTRYPSCTYDAARYLAAFKAVAPKVRAAYPDVTIHADSQHGWQGERGRAILADPEALRYVDAWTFHRIGADSNQQLTGDFTSGAAGRPVFSNEFEYLERQGPMSDWRTVNTAQSIMNWMTFQNSPTWFWLHALKPTTNAEAENYALGFWRPPHDTDFSRFPHIAPGHWDFNPRNWNAVAGFVKYLPWDSVRHHVDEPLHTDGSPYTGQRIMAWRTPQGKPVLAVTNRDDTPYTYTVDTRTAATFHGHRYGPATHNRTLAAKAGPTLEFTVPGKSIEFWVRA
ncbi:hypothetical protein [Kitasatospora sp. NPDC004289]